MQKRQIITPLFLLVKYYISSVNYGLSLFNVQLFVRRGDMKAKVPLSAEQLIQLKLEPVPEFFYKRIFLDDF